MSTSVLRHASQEESTSLRVSTASLPSDWLLVLPLVFFAAHGVFSFQLAGDAVARGGLGIVAVRVRGITGQIVLPCVVYAIVLRLIYREFSAVLSFAKQFKMLTLLACLTIMSAAWSQDPSRSMLFGCFYLIGTFFAYYLSATLRPGELAMLVMKAGGIVFVVSFLLVVFLPYYGVTHDNARMYGTWRGMFIDRASASKCFVFLLSLGITVKGIRRSRRCVYVAAMLLMIICSRAVTALIVTAIYLAFMGFLRTARRVDRRLLVVLTIVVGGLVGLALIVGSGKSGEFFSLFGRDPTLSGRTEVWSAVTNVIFQRPVLGFGYYAFWQTPSSQLTNILSAVKWTFGYAHNGILEIALQLGMVGVAIFGLTLARGLLDCWFCIRSDTEGAYDWLVGLILLTILYNIDEATVVLPNELLSILYVITCCTLAVARADLHNGRTGASS